MSMLYRYTLIVILFLLSFFLFSGSYAAWWDWGKLPQPPLTKLDRQKERNDRIDFVGSDYYYDSELSKQDILDFYRKQFKSQGYHEVNKDTRGDKKTVFIFKDKDEKKVYVLIFSVRMKGMPLRYTLKVGQFKEYSVEDVLRKAPPELAAQMKEMIDSYKQRQRVEIQNVHLLQHLEQPRRTDFMPLFPGVRQIEYNEWKAPPSISTGYLTPVDANEVISFYIERMPSYGWLLKSREDHTGRYTIDQWFPMIAPRSKFCPSCGAIPVEVPPLQIHGATLTFSSGKKKCIVTVHTFDDAVELSYNHPYDLSAMEQYGSTIIGVVYYR